MIPITFPNHTAHPVFVGSKTDRVTGPNKNRSVYPVRPSHNIVILAYISCVLAAVERCTNAYQTRERNTKKCRAIRNSIEHTHTHMSATLCGGSAFLFFCRSMLYAQQQQEPQQNVKQPKSPKRNNGSNFWACARAHKTHDAHTHAWQKAARRRCAKMPTITIYFCVHNTHTHANTGRQNEL